MHRYQVCKVDDNGKVIAIKATFRTHDAAYNFLRTHYGYSTSTYRIIHTYMI